MLRAGEVQGRVATPSPTPLNKQPHWPLSPMLWTKVHDVALFRNNHRRIETIWGGRGWAGDVPT